MAIMTVLYAWYESPRGSVPVVLHRICQQPSRDFLIWRFVWIYVCIMRSWLHRQRCTKQWPRQRYSTRR